MTGDPPQQPGKEADAFYRVPLSSGEALATLALLRAVDGLLTSGVLHETDLEPNILASAAERIADEVPEFVAVRAEVIAGSLARALRTDLTPAAEDRDTPDAPPFPIRRTRRLLEDAYEQHLPVEIEYFVSGRKEWTLRRVDISSVYEQNGTWYLSGQCGLRSDHRQFRLDHIRSVRVLDEEAAVPDPFSG